MIERGFTVLEIVFAIAIMTIVVTIVALTFNKINNNQALDHAVESVVSVLNEARSLTLSAKSGMQYGVNIQGSQVVRFAGSSYFSGDANNVVFPINNRVGIRNISLTGGGSSIVFTRLTGATSQTGTFEIYLTEATTTYETIAVTATGVIEKN